MGGWAVLELTGTLVHIHLNRISSKSGSRSFPYAAAELFNDLPNHVKNFDSIRSFTSNYWFEK